MGKAALKMFVALATLVFLAGCIGKLVGVTVTVMDEQTALEQQVLGSYEEIGSDLMLLASVRAVDAQGRLKEMPEVSERKRQVLAAMQSREFNRDDILAVKAMGAAGENNRGYLDYFLVEKTKSDPQYEAFVKALIEEENQDRTVIMGRILEVNEQFTKDDMPLVEKIFARLNRENARPGELIQLEDGTWTKKE